MAVLEDAGQPAFVRNDFRGAFLQRDDGSAYEQFVAEHYGRSGLPAAAAPVSRPDIASFFASADAGDWPIGLSVASSPRVTIPPMSRSSGTPRSPTWFAGRGNRWSFPSPTLSSLVLRPVQSRHYLALEGHRVLAYENNRDAGAISSR